VGSEATRSVFGVRVASKTKLPLCGGQAGSLAFSAGLRAESGSFAGLAARSPKLASLAAKKCREAAFCGVPRPRHSSFVTHHSSLPPGPKAEALVVPPDASALQRRFASTNPPPGFATLLPGWLWPPGPAFQRVDFIPGLPHGSGPPRAASASSEARKAKNNPLPKLGNGLPHTEE
jgi:hypothetical protein